MVWSGFVRRSWPVDSCLWQVQCRVEAEGNTGNRAFQKPSGGGGGEVGKGKASLKEKSLPSVQERNETAARRVEATTSTARRKKATTVPVKGMCPGKRRSTSLRMQARQAKSAEGVRREESEEDLL